MIGTDLVARCCLGAFILPAVPSSCQEQQSPPVVFDNRPPIVAEVSPPPISGGTLIATADGRVVAADSDRDRVHVISVSPARYDADVQFEQGAEPGRLIEGSAGLVHVVLRGAGDLAAIDTSSGEVVSRRHLCTDPRGLAFDDASASLYVACLDGTLVVLPEDPEAAEVQRHFIEPDLRDVIIDGGTLLISRLRSAEILVVSMSGSQVIGRRTPAGAGRLGDTAVATVGWRMISPEPGQVAMVHQFSSTTEVRIAPVDEDDDELPYGGSDPCEPPIVSAGVSTWLGSDEAVTSQLGGATPAVDLAMGPDGNFAVAVAGAPDGEADIHFSGTGDFCFEPPTISTPGQPVAVVYLPDGRLVVQSREPAALYVYNEQHEHELTIELSSSSRFDTGHDLYHRTTDAGISCASCHPEGTDDGHVWLFAELGLRRTQSPEIGLEGSAPFHWDGDMTDFRTLSNEVYTHRMGGAMQSDKRADAFERWLFSAKREAAGTLVDETMRAEGEALFIDHGCATCHTGARFSNDETVDILGKRLQVPSLRRVALRPPYMHDGRAADLRSAVLDMLDSTKPDVAYSSHDVDALVVYLQTL